MRFVIGNTIDFEQHGFNTENFRKSLDGTKCIIHLEFAKTLISDIEENENFEIHTQAEMQSILATEEWAKQEEKIEV